MCFKHTIPCDAFLVAQETLSHSKSLRDLPPLTPARARTTLTKPLTSQERRGKVPSGLSPSLVGVQLKVSMAPPLQESAIDLYATKLRAIRRDLRDEYQQPHGKPWIVGFSGGKDSTVLAHLIFEMLLSLPPDLRKREVFVVSNDTRVESPSFQAFVEKLLDSMTDGVAALQVPIRVARTTPLDEESFWVNMLGRGYPAPNRTFRWCTDRMKIRPTSKFIREQVNRNGEAILLLGVRSSESSARAGNIARHSVGAEGRLSPHADHKGVWVFNPIKGLTTEEVWITLVGARPPWGGSYSELIRLYKSAQAGECPFVTSDADAPSCGTNSARFGCWTCTVVEKDNSLESMVAAGQGHLEPLVLLRRRLKEVSEDPNCRSKTRRNGQPGLGPLTYDARAMLLEELLAAQAKVGMPLISDLEIRLIRDQWAADKSDELFREYSRSIEAQ